MTKWEVVTREFWELEGQVAGVSSGNESLSQTGESACGGRGAPSGALPHSHWYGAQPFNEGVPGVCLSLPPQHWNYQHTPPRQAVFKTDAGWGSTQVLMIARQALYCLSHLSAVAFMPLNFMFLPVFHWDDLCPELFPIPQCCVSLPACLESS